MDKNERLTALIYRLHQSQFIAISKYEMNYEPQLILDLRVLESKGVAREFKQLQFELTGAGIELVEDNLTYNDHLQKTESFTVSPINISGNNNRIYHNSEDHSNNVVIQSGADIFEQIKQIIDDKIEGNATILAALDELKAAKGHANYAEKYATFIANVANHITLLSPFLTHLTAFIQ